MNLWPTPTSDSACERSENYKQGGTPLIVAVRSSEKDPPPRPSQLDLFGESVAAGSSEARAMTVRSGQRCAMLVRLSKLQLADLAATFLGSARWNSAICFLNWREAATPGGRLLFQLTPSLPEELGGEMFLTPNAMDSLEPRSEAALLRQHENNRPGRTTHSTLREQIAYPPPNKIWPTPTEDDASNVFPKENRREGLVSVVNDAVDNNPNTQLGSLNPLWVEWLMGYPAGWTEV